MNQRSKHSPFSRFTCLLLALSLAIPASVFAAAPPTPGAQSPGLQVGQAVANLKTPAGNAVYVASEDSGRVRVLAVEYGQVVEGTLENGRVGWDTSLPSAAEKSGNQNDRPSRLAERLAWNSDSSNQVREQIQDVQAGKAESKSLGQKVKGGAAYLGQGAAYFYVALGLVAAVQVFMFHSSNPMAIKRYMDTLTDPVGYAALAGFMIAAYPFFRSMAKPKNAPLHRYLPRFAAGLVVGGLVSSVITEIGRDPNVRACMNLDKITEIGEGAKPDRDMGSCDKAFEQWTKPAVIADKMAPHLGTILAAGGMYWGSSYLLAKWRVPAMLMGLKLPKFGTSRGGSLASTIAIQAGHMMLFLGAYHVAKHVLGIEDGIREQLLMKYSFQKNEMGATLTQTFNNLAFNLAQLEKSKYDDKDYAVKTVALQTHLSGQLYAWRMLQLQPTKYAADQWVEKLTNFQHTLNKSYELYEDVLKRIANERANPNLPANDPTRLTMEYLTSNYLANDKLGYNGKFDDPDHWEYVKSRSLLEYVVGSMACGPEVQLPYQDRPWNGISNFVFNRKPQKGSVVNTGRADEFRPPMLTMANQEERICNQNVLGLQAKVPALEYQVVAVVTGPDGKKPIQVQEKNILEYARKNIRADLIGPDHQLHFDDWWKKYVLSDVQTTYDRYEQQYSSIINGPLKKALTRDDYNCLTGARNLFVNEAGPEAFKNTYTTNRCSKPSERSLAKGVLNSLRDEKNSYFTLVRSLPQLKADPAKHQQLNEALTRLDAQIEAGLKGLSDNLGKKVDVNVMKNEFLILQKKVNDLFPQPPELTPAQLNAGIAKLITKVQAAREELLQKRNAAASVSAPASSASSPALAASAVATSASAPSAAASSPKFSIKGKIGALEDLAKVPEIRAVMEKDVKAEAIVEFYGKNPHLGLLRQNLSLIDSIYEQIRLLHSYSAIPDRSGPAFLGN